MKRDEVLAQERDQAELRERINPGWREQLKEHREELCVGRDTKGMGAREIINRAMKINYDYDPRKKRRRLG